MSVHTIVKDFDTIIPPARWVRLGGRDLDLTRIPSKAVIELLQYADEVHGKPAEDVTGADALRLFEIVADVVESQNEGVDLSWLEEHTTTDQLLSFTRYVASLIKGGAAPDTSTSQEAAGKN